MSLTLKPYPVWCCAECAVKQLGEEDRPLMRVVIATFHEDTCDVCGKIKTVTEPRDFHYPVWPGFKKP